ncbi:hypothetical protein MA5S0422_3943 [Mycobacteroides abscessus 5S-0422]|uniref:HTH cro/C1-type domain-containing protein n=2 Tax=Mycobacteroides abscessus TaxID=36809 RepID=X8DF41_9MYCO|nr:hypothetical protein MA5S0422_3943 [Mycobacteroides abscessus 5S-0422]EIU05569.1 hypothetical protein MA5S0421_3024 [Mycobacteroides abscessus 5S-0421]EIU09383.1 hypothetical protein MA5S0304_2769 [Mycobacteroides abscessus 5S-0304]EIU25506.1 hypothetical protein MA5S0817_2315 [Mycobacteroides abscessus 5S-0817]EIU45417.1 hypothetical protein MA5S1215_2806 [Mycobacteroides abscessus 5S-1215]EIU87050.1 hypothetical protein MA5S0921_3728 [Mycobacteroides abscessus 5S-0921]EUA66701.1 hypothet
MRRIMRKCFPIREEVLSMTDDNEKRLGSLIRARRKHPEVQLHTAAELAEAAGVSLRLISDIETGKRSNLLSRNKDAIEQAIKWAPGSIDDVLDGGAPTLWEDLEREHPMLNPGVPIELVAQTLSSLLDKMEKIDKLETLMEGQIGYFQGVADANSRFPAPVELEQALAESRAEERNARIFFGQQIMKTIAAADPATSDKVLELFTPLLARAMDPEALKLPSTRSGNVTSIARRRPAGPPPDLEDLGVAASRREKQSDRERNDDDSDGLYVLSLQDLSSGDRTRREFTSRAEAEAYAREFLIAQGEKPRMVDAAIKDAGRHTADTSGSGYGVRIRKVKSASQSLKREPGGFEVEFYDPRTDSNFGRMVAPTRKEAERLAREELLRLGEAKENVDNAVRNAGYTVADTRHGGYGVRIAELADQ